MISVKDMPKLESPFLREMIKEDYILTPKITAGYEWVFEDTEVLATEKLDGTNVSIVIENGRITSIWNRTAEVPFFCKGREHIIEGVLEAFKRGYTDLSDGQWFGELIGEKVNGNPYQLKGHLWVPFATYAKEHLAYKSWGRYPKTFEAISQWFKEDIFSLFMRKKGIVQKPEGVVFVHLKTGIMAKLRRDMFDWFEGPRHKEFVSGKIK